MRQIAAKNFTRPIRRAELTTQANGFLSYDTRTHRLTAYATMKLP